MGPIAVSIATAAAPYAVKGILSWGSNAVKTWGPSYVATATIEGSAKAGQDLMGGGSGVFGTIGSIAGRIFGWGAAPFVAQSAPVQGTINGAANLLTPEVVAAGVTGASTVLAAAISTGRKVEAKPLNQEVDVNLLLQVLNKMNFQEYAPKPLSEEDRWRIYG